MRFPAYKKKPKKLASIYDKSKRKNSPRNMCPFCGTSYKFETMAATCMKTTRCRQFNMPSDRVRYEWGIQSGTAGIVIFASKILEDLESTHDKALEVRDTCFDVCDRIKYSYPVGYKIALTHETRLLDQVIKIWPINSKIRVLRILRVAMTLVDDVIIHNTPYWDDEEAKLNKIIERNGVAKDVTNRKYWKALFTGLTDLFNLLNPDNEPDEENDRTTDDYYALYDFLWGELKLVADPSVYLVNGRFWVVAKNRQEVRDHMLKHFGLVNTTIRGYALGTKLDNGKIIQDFLEDVNTVPDVVISDARPL